MSSSIVQDNEKLTPKISTQVKDVALLRTSPAVLHFKNQKLNFREKGDKIVDKKVAKVIKIWKIVYPESK